ncbi:MAG: class I SAM-dependent methyltransferase [Gammaproteobacteria bacterium]
MPKSSILLPFIVAGVLLTAAGATALAGDAAYHQGPKSRDGIGKFYFGREIAHVMGHLGAGWLERPTREAEERTDLLLAALDVRPGDVVADIGAGTGYFTLPLAQRVGDGRVYAVDLQPEMLAIVRRRAADAGLDNIELVLASETDPRLPPASLDRVLLVDAYHEFSYPREVMQRVLEALRPDGRVYLVEYRAEDPAVPIKPLHKMSEAQARRELAAAGFVFLDNLDVLPQQHILVFTRPPGAGDAAP